ncbi:MAG: substrate-binding domain-containing protein [Oscillospiraceae bacterium]|nr:substrate-binding domain-containing protein [Oscillospiraceae bacterium]
MYKIYKRFVIFLMILPLLWCANLLGCTGQSAKYPKISITQNEAQIPYFTIPIKWKGADADGPSAYEYAMTQNPEMENLVEVSSGDTIKVDFMQKKPEKIKVAYELLTVLYYGDAENTYSAIDEFELNFDVEENRYSFQIDKFEMESDFDYYLMFTPRYYYDNPGLYYIAGRVYKITATWGEDECEYAFVVKNTEDIGKDDMRPADRSQNINVMLTRSGDWQKIVTEPIISEKDMGIIDGSTATIPITAELYRQFFDYSDEKLNDEYYYHFSHSTTHYAYINLIERGYGNSNPKSLIFVTPPSEQEEQMAREAKIELEITPIAKDGFVFITHKDNPIDNLTVEQIQAIYTGEITNWKELGGEDMEIQAYQREPNSGSQTAMEQMVMQEKKMIEPIDTQVFDGMAGLIEAVAEYDNKTSSIGYTYYYYINNLYKNENIKVLKVNGITPENENLTNETYPFATSYYAIIRSDEAPGSPARKLRDFLVTEQGQQLVEMAGYCRLPVASKYQ